MMTYTAQRLAGPGGNGRDGYGPGSTPSIKRISTGIAANNP